MLDTFDPQVASDLNQLMQTHQDDPSGERLKRAVETLNRSAEKVLEHWSATADPMQRSQTMTLHDGLRAAANIVSDFIAPPKFAP